MTPDEERATAGQMLAAARALLAAWPDPDALRAVDVGGVPAGTGPLAHTLTCLRDEMLLVRVGTAGGTGVLADEIAHAEAVLAGR